MYSGYINLPGTQKYYHYIFVPSTGKPSTDPVVLWLNGGPGCSSLDGFFYEHGPYKFGPGLENITLVNNPYAYVDYEEEVSISERLTERYVQREWVSF